jgi:hypothetical protein
MNYIIEEESFKTVCPLGVGGETVHIKGIPAGKGCIGHRCASWRWETIKDQWNDKEDKWDIEYSSTQGYCGMVGE